MHKFSDYLFQKASINKIPLSGTFELSPVCNFSCKMCYVRKTSDQIKKEGKRLRDWTEWLELAKQCREAGMLYLLITGGEPFIYPHFKELYGALHSMGFLISINTNGTMIDEETVKWLKNAAPTRINVTLYGASSETYGNICENAAGFERAKKAILMLKESGINVVINGSMIPQNEKDLEDIIAFGKEHDIFTRISTYMFPPMRREREADDSRCTPQEAAEIYMRKNRCMLEDIEHSSFMESQIKTLSEHKGSEDLDWGTNMEVMRCRAGRCSFWVSWEGIMTACGVMPFPMEVYPFKESFQECWMKLTEKVRTTKVLKECCSCEKKEICNPCAAMLYAETGDVNQKAPYMCQLTDCIIDKMKSELHRRTDHE